MKESLVHNHLLVFEAGFQDSREFWFKELKQLGYRLFLTQPAPATWERPYIDDYLPCRFDNWKPVELDKIVDFCLKKKISGILCLIEGTVPFCQDLATALSLPRLCRTDARNLRNKRLMRQSLLGSEVHQPTFEVVDSETLDVNKIRTFPVIVKPAELMASLGVKYVSSAGDLRSAVKLASQVDFVGEDLRANYKLSDEVLIEQYIEGDEYSVESLVQDGTLIDFFVTKKWRCELPYFDEIGHMTNPDLSEVDRAKIQKFVQEVHARLGILNGVTHTEFRFGQGKIPFLIEVGCRPGGDLIPLAHGLGSGLSLVDTAAKIACGEKIKPSATSVRERKSVGIFFPFVTLNYKKFPEPAALEKILKDSSRHVYSLKIPADGRVDFDEGLFTKRLGKIVFESADGPATGAVLDELAAYCSQL